MKTVQVSRRNTQRRRLLAAGALSAVVALSHVDSAFAACTANTQHVVVTSGSGACANCPTGTKQTRGADDETQNAATFCDVIDTGFYGAAGTGTGASGAHATLQGCALNYYGATTGSSISCTACPGSTVTARVGSATLAECVTASGQYVKVASTTAGSVVIETTPANWYSKGGVSVTDTTKATNVAAGNLVVGTHSSETKDIQACPAGSDTGSSTGSGSCSPCSIGETSVSGAACAACAADTYNDVAGSTSCTACPTMNGVATKTTGTSAGDHDAVQDCFADLDATQAATIGALGQVPGFIPANDGTELQFGKLRVNVCPKGTYGKTWDLENILDAQDALMAAGASARTYCESTLPGYWGTQGSGAHAGASALEKCHENSSSDAESTSASDCFCDSGYYFDGVACVALPAASPTAASPTAESAGASTPIAVALAAAAAVPLLL